MRLTEFIAKLSKMADHIPDAEVLVDGWPVIIDALPAYYDGPSKRYDPVTNTLIFIRNGSKVALSSFGMAELAELHPGLNLDTTELPEWQAAWYRGKLDESRQASNAKDQGADK